MHPDAGEVVSLVLAIFDKSYLERIGSPFARLLQGMRDDESVRWFYKAFAGELVKYDTQEPCRNRTRNLFQNGGQMMLSGSPNTA